jgi:hypothetical protein
MAGGQILTLEFVLWHKLGHKLGESGATVSLTWADVSNAPESRRELCWLLCRKTR